VTDRAPGPRTSTTYALLGLLALRDWTTYELAKQVQRSLHWFWPRAERKLYDEPKRLVADGLATASAEATGKRPKTVYSITPSGRAALGEWLDEPSAARTTEWEGLVKVFFADAGTAEQLRTNLDRVVAESESRLQQLADTMQVGLDAPPFPGRLHIQVLCLKALVEEELSLLRWARWARDEVDGWDDTQTAGDDHRDLLQGLVDEARASIGSRV
jgi:PadR family transcriptional regulator AphA